MQEEKKIDIKLLFVFLLLQGRLSQEPRRVEGKLFFLSHGGHEEQGLPQEAHLLSSLIPSFHGASPVLSAKP